MNKTKKNNVVSFPLTASEVEREVEAILFAAVEPLDIESIETFDSLQDAVEEHTKKES